MPPPAISPLATPHAADLAPAVACDASTGWPLPGFDDLREDRVPNATRWTPPQAANDADAAAT